MSTGMLGTRPAMLADELDRMAKKLFADARKWRAINPPCGYTDGVVRGLHEAAKSCRRRAKKLRKGRA